MTRHTLSLLLLLLGSQVGVAAATVQEEVRGEASVTLTTNDGEPRALAANLRYLPELMISAAIGRSHEVAGLASFDLTWRNRIVSLNNARGETDAEAYRLWLRYLAPRYEIRLGRQKLSFGSATLLRPLMWFDSVDPRDPLQRNPGVDALLGRVYLWESSNFWLWSVRGADEPRGWEIAPTAAEKTEFGGRLQLPAGNGEIALTYHHRRAELAIPPSPGAVGPALLEVPEDRFALDGKWDVTVGLWFEAAWIRQGEGELERPYRRFASAGLDYTFDLGQGLTVLCEHLALGASEEAFGESPITDFSAMSLRLPRGVVDEFRLLVYRDWDRRDWYRFLEWRRSYDRWSMHLIAFVNPDEATPSPLLPGGAQLSGFGGQAAVILNH